MIYYILPTCIAMLSLGINKPTTLRFDSAIEYVSLGSEDSFVVELSNNKKLLTLKPITAQNNAPLVVVTKNGDFQFQGNTTSSKFYSQFVDVKKGEVSKMFEKVYSNRSFKVLEGSHSNRVINKAKKPMLVNGFQAKKQVDTCKGFPLIVNGREVTW